MAKQVVRDVEKEFAGKLQVEEIDTWTPPGEMKALEYKIFAVPTLVINEKEKIVGVPNRQKLVEAIRKELAAEET